MTPTTLAAAILRDVPIRGRIYTGGRINTGGNCLDELVLKKDVLAALTAALDPAIAERAGDVAKRLRAVCTCNIDSSPCMAEDDCRDAISAADLITALLTANAALRAERDKWMERCGRERAFASSHLIRAEAAEAQKAALTARVEGLEAMLYQMIDDPEYWTPYARAALSTTEEGHE